MKIKRQRKPRKPRNIFSEKVGEEKQNKKSEKSDTGRLYQLPPLSLKNSVGFFSIIYLIIY